MAKGLRALLLAAGLGTRLRPLTNHTPKCLVSLGGEPLLGHWFNQLEKLGCQATLVNTHHLAGQVEDFVQTWQSENMIVNTCHEPKLLGTAGTLLANRQWFQEETGILIHADNATTADLSEFLKVHRQKPKNCLLTMLTFSSSNPEKCGVVETDQKGLVTGFHEKIAKPPTNCANGAVYLFDFEFIKWIENLDFKVKDLSIDVIPLLIGRIQTWHTNEPYIDIGTPESLNVARSTIGNKLGLL